MEKITKKSQSGKDFLLFRKVHNIYIKSSDPNRISPGAFKDEFGVSTYWSKYADKYKAQKGDGKQDPNDYGVVSLKVSSIVDNKEGIELKIKHRPRPMRELNSQAHTNIYGLRNYPILTGRRKYNKAQVFLARKASWEINSKI